MLRSSLAAVALVAAPLTMPALISTAHAAAADYRFELVSARSAGPNTTDVTLRLMHVPDAKPISGAVIFQPKAVMAGMESMPGAASAEPGPQSGTYLVHAATSMAGPWTLQLSAKVQGEAETVRAAVPFEAGK